ncbi:hypothetical protein AB6A40_008510 [Gnathostoma spinigerum]|uniref:Uncharacterized protein n=1 Tax=Gnathostoma spinigerum TaxID=75299 RepID=A0ABD6EPN7_9BILA
MMLPSSFGQESPHLVYPGLPAKPPTLNAKCEKEFMEEAIKLLQKTDKNSDVNWLCVLNGDEFRGGRECNAHVTTSGKAYDITGRLYYGGGVADMKAKLVGDAKL